MFAPDPDLDPGDDEGDGIAEDRRGRILRRMLYPALALAAAGAIAWLGGCGGGEAPSGPGAPPDAVRVEDRAAAPFTFFAGGDEWKMVQDGAERLELDGRGYAYLPDEYGPDFTVAYEYRFPDAAEMPEGERPKCNTGCLLFITGEDKVWPRCLEVQGRWDDTAQIKSNARDVTVTATLDEPARDAARKPPSEWNRVEIVSVGGALAVTLNGVEVAQSEPTELTRGRIGFQAEGFPVEFRNVTIE